MKFLNQFNGVTLILILLAFLLPILCFILYHTNKEVRNLKSRIAKNQMSIENTHNLLNNLGLGAIGMNNPNIIMKMNEKNNEEETDEEETDEEETDEEETDDEEEQQETTTTKEQTSDNKSTENNIDDESSSSSDYSDSDEDVLD